MILLRHEVLISVLVLGAALSASAGSPVIIFNEDSDNAMRPAWYADPKHYTEDELAHYYSSIIDGGKVSHLFFCVNARCSAYPSKVAPNYWDAIGRPGYDRPQWLVSMRDLIVGQGVDQFKLGIGLCRKRGVSPWISIRMNDIHFPTDPKFFLNIGFWKEHPELWIEPEAATNGCMRWEARAFDYRKEGVHVHMLDYVREALERYDVDGIEFDWMRFEHHSPRSVARTEGADGVNAFMRKAKRLVDEIGRKRGRKISVAARVDSDPVSAINHGTDWCTWAREGLIDWLVACNFFDTADFDIPLASWSAEIAKLNPNVILLPGLDCGIRLPGEKKRFLTADEYAGWGEKMYRQGAKGAYFFNLFCQPSGTKLCETASWDLVTKEGFTPENLARRPKTVPANAPRECVRNGWTGRKDESIVVGEGGVTPHAALSLVRAIRASGNVSPVTIKFRGTVRVTEPIVFTSADRHVTIRGEQGAAVSGGLRIGGWRDAGAGVWEANLPKGADGKSAYFEQIYVNGRRADCARLPNGNAYFRGAGQDLRAVGDGKGYENLPANLPTYGLACRAFTILNESDYAKLAALRDEDVPYARQIRHIKWDIDRYPLIWLDRTRRLTCTVARKWAGGNRFAAGDPIHFENVRTAFDMPGEWYYDGANGKVLYRPLPGETLEKLDVVVPMDGLESLLVFRGDAAKGEWAGDVTVENIVFEHCDAKSYKGPTLVSSYQAGAFSCCATILADAARNIVLRDCKVRHNGSYAVWFRGGCMSNAVVNCEFTDLGGGGVKIGEFDDSNVDCRPRGAAKATRYGPRSTAFNTVENCLIAHGGRVHMAGCGVLIGHSSDNRIEHNDILDFYYTGVSVGWVWGYSGSVAQRNYVGYNHIRDIGQKQLADMGGVYTLGTSFGTVIEFNRIHDVDSYSYGGWGLYADEGSEGIVVRNNLVYDTKCESFHQHFGRDNVISNNVFAFSVEPCAAIAITRSEPHRSIVFANNIACFDFPVAVRTGNGTKADWQGNCWWNPSEKPFKMLNGLDFAEWQKLGRDTTGCVADPKFRDPRRRDFTLGEGSPALKCGFRPFDVSTAGRAVKRCPE